MDPDFVRDLAHCLQALLVCMNIFLMIIQIDLLRKYRITMRTNNDDNDVKILTSKMVIMTIIMKMIISMPIMVAIILKMIISMSMMILMRIVEMAIIVTMIMRMMISDFSLRSMTVAELRSLPS